MGEDIHSFHAGGMEKIPCLDEVLRECSSFVRVEVCVGDSSLLSWEINVDFSSLHSELERGVCFPGEVSLSTFLSHIWTDHDLLPCERLPPPTLLPSSSDAGESKGEEEGSTKRRMVTRSSVPGSKRQFVWSGSCFRQETPTSPPLSTLDSHSTTSPPLSSFHPTTFLLPHQKRSLAWMRSVEREGGGVVSYVNGVPLHPSASTTTLGSDTNERGWSFSTERMFQRSPLPSREERYCGGILADGTGSGKTAVSVCHAIDLDVEGVPPPSPPTASSSSSSLLRSKASLIILPLNLPTQWLGEVEKVSSLSGRKVRVVRMLTGKDMQQTSLSDLLESDIVLTTFPFLRQSKPYSEMVDACLSGVSSSFGTAHSPSFPPPLTLPPSHTNLSSLPSFPQTPRVCPSLFAWSRSASLSPSTSSPFLEAVRWRRVIVDEVHRSLSCKQDARCLLGLDYDFFWGVSATPTLEREGQVYLSRLVCKHSFPPRSASYFHSLLGECVRGSPSQLDLSPVRVVRSIRLTSEEERILRTQSADLGEEEVVKLCTFWNMEHSVQEGTGRSLTPLHSEESIVGTKFVEERAKLVGRREEVCPICLERVSTTITPCGHLYCRHCIGRHVQSKGNCPECRERVREQDLRCVVPSNSILAKMEAVASFVKDLGERSILFVQWKSMVRPIVSFLRGHSVHAILLDGNASRRASSLSSFSSSPTDQDSSSPSSSFPCLVLCLEDRFEGLHLPHARNVVFTHAIVANAEKVKDLEEQAIARVLRFGQTESVYVHSFIVSDTVEERVWSETH